MATLSALRNIGSAAARDIGSSGGSVPLLDGANVFSGAVTIGAGQSLAFGGVAGGASQLIAFRDSGGADRFYLGRDNAAGNVFINRYTSAGAYVDTPLSIPANGGGDPNVRGHLIYHAGNAGAGGGQNADMVDGYHASAFGLLAGNQTWSGNQTWAGQCFAQQGLFFVRSASPTDQKVWDFVLGAASFGLRAINDAYSVSTTALEVTRSGIGITGINIPSGAVSIGGSLAARAATSSETSGVLTVASANRQITASGAITVPAGVFAAGDIVLIDGGGAARTITQGVGMTMRWNGGTGNRTLAHDGLMVLRFRNSAECVIGGSGVS
jgi:hypothetical protein